MTKQQLLDKLNSSDELEDESSTINDDIIDSIVSEIAGLDMDIISDYDLEMSYREVELSGITLDNGNIEEAVRQAIKNNQ